VVRLDATVTPTNLASWSRASTSCAQARRGSRPSATAGAEVVPAELMERRDDPGAARIIEGERKLFELRQAAHAGQKLQLRERVEQLRREIEGVDTQATAKAEEEVLIQKERVGSRDLWNRKLYAITKLTYLEREATRIEGECAARCRHGADPRQDCGDRVADRPDRPRSRERRGPRAARSQSQDRCWNARW